MEVTIKFESDRMIFAIKKAQIHAKVLFLLIKITKKKTIAVFSQINKLNCILNSR